MNSNIKEILIFENQLNVDIESLVKAHYKRIRRFAYILHDKLTARPHYHIVLEFYGNVSKNLLASWFEIPRDYICSARGDISAYVRYLLHTNGYSYPLSELKTNYSLTEL